MTTSTTDCFAIGDRLLSLDEALAAIPERVTPAVAVERVPLRAAAGRVLAADLIATVTHPAEDTSAMDGYAVRHSDLSPTEPVTLPVTARVAAGHPLGRPLASGEAARIFTGGVMPAGADTVIMQEDVTDTGDGRATLPAGVPLRRHVRAAGGDFRTGTTVMTAGRRLTPLDIALAAAAGHPFVPVCERVRIGVFSTGDEVFEPGAALPPGGLYDGNRYGLMALAEALGAEVTDLGHLPDDLDRITAALGGAADEHHLLLTSGGVSVGGEDHVRDAVEALGVLHFWRLAIKPGKPAALGQIRDAAFAGLPGNPVSALVTFLLIVRPLVQRLGGQTVTPPLRYPLPAGFHHTKAGHRREFLRAWIETGPEGPVLRTAASQDSAMVRSMSAAGGLVDVPEDHRAIEPGDLVDYLPFAEVMS
ncbi:molybdopterin molybdotransferase MoeA [Roseospira marina]|uniref:Molybdopterin molybdenumtransferase n=1 Tax=Roseospira marina TaxID=140057 RepID=A0A5M6IFZ2_9PROT|nr:gephyrin-like molybdotransferase Glp [Roseospira marina]KAA5607216.1 molybdopterin molybdotransferase MoeA [Roseospira marina]MBB4312634.1 molybdopterin molybdotransferase [Roseospira marina]MBB5085350.1 molybdopterin molybdotransferase [Roseospira marina]